MGKIFDIRIEGVKDHPLFERFMKAGRDKSIWNELTRESAKSVAEFARDKMSGYLKPKGQFNVGATGKASRNLGVIETENSQGYESYGIIEFKGYKANYFIRRGFKGVKQGRHVPLDKIREWAAAKGIHFTGEGGGKDPYARFVRQRVGRGKDPEKYYVRSLRKSHTPDADAGLKRLAAYIERNGSKESHWTNLYPQGKPRFDYVVFVLRHEQTVRRAIKRAAGGLVKGYIEYVASGKRPATERVYDVRDIARRK